MARKQAMMKPGAALGTDVGMDSLQRRRCEGQIRRRPAGAGVGDCPFRVQPPVHISRVLAGTSISTQP